MNIRTLFISAALAAGTISFAAACSSGPAPITAHSTMTVDYTMSGFYGGAGDDLSDGSQVVIVNSAGTVIGTGALTTTSGTSLGGGDMKDTFSFTMKVPGGLPRYGIQVGGTSHGTVWESAQQMRSGPALTLDETTDGS
jgi:hypothetical protein